MSGKTLRNVTCEDLVGRIVPGTTVYKNKVPLKVKGVTWFGDYEMDVIECDDGRSYPATTLQVAATK